MKYRNAKYQKCNTRNAIPKCNTRMAIHKWNTEMQNTRMATERRRMLMSLMSQKPPVSNWNIFMISVSGIIMLFSSPDNLLLYWRWQQRPKAFSVSLESLNLMSYFDQANLALKFVRYITDEMMMMMCKGEPSTWIFRKTWSFGPTGLTPPSPSPNAGTPKTNKNYVYFSF